MSLLATMSNNLVKDYVTEANEVYHKMTEEHDKLNAQLFDCTMFSEWRIPEENFSFVCVNFMEESIFDRSDNLHC
jgi:hypothetical protein